MTDSIALNLTLNANDAGGGWNGWTVLPVFDAVALTLPSGAISDVRFTFNASTAEGLTIGACYVGHVKDASDAFDFISTPTQVTFDGGSGSKSISAAGSAVCDWINFIYNKTNRLGVAMYINAPTDSFRIRSGLSNINTYYYGDNTAATVDKSGYTLLSGDCYGVSKIEVRSVDAASKAFAMFY